MSSCHCVFVLKLLGSCNLEFVFWTFTPSDLRLRYPNPVLHCSVVPLIRSYYICILITGEDLYPELKHYSLICISPSYRKDYREIKLFLSNLFFKIVRELRKTFGKKDTYSFQELKIIFNKTGYNPDNLIYSAALLCSKEIFIEEFSESVYHKYSYNFTLLKNIKNNPELLKKKQNKNIMCFAIFDLFNKIDTRDFFNFQSTGYEADLAD